VKTFTASIPLLLIALGAGLPSAGAVAADDTFTVAIRDHRFEPSVVEVPAGKKLKLVVKNLDPTPEEFESHDLKREKIIAGKGQATINIGPLKPGTYKFVGEYHESTAQGQIVAK
jgi:plastocyanin